MSYKTLVIAAALLAFVGTSFISGNAIAAGKTKNTTTGTDANGIPNCPKGERRYYSFSHINDPGLYPNCPNTCLNEGCHSPKSVAGWGYFTDQNSCWKALNDYHRRSPECYHPKKPDTIIHQTKPDHPRAPVKPIEREPVKPMHRKPVKPTDQNPPQQR